MKLEVSFDRLTTGLLFVALALTACLMAAQSDTFWALRAGEDIWRTWRVPRVDSYSYTAAGLPWPDHEWLWQACAFALYRAGGMPLLTLAVAAAAVGAVAIVHRLMVGPASTRFVLLVVAIPLATVVWALRPQIVTLLFLAVLVCALANDRYLVLPPLFLVWANAHGGVVLGGLVAVAAFVTAALRARRGGARDRRRVLILGCLLPVCGLAAAATPLGFGILGFVLRSESRLRQAQINEWLPTLPNAPFEGAFWVVALAFACVVVWRWRALREGSFADWVIVAAALALFPLAFRSVRNVGPFLILAPAAASRLLGPTFRFRRRPAPVTPDRPGLNAAILAVFAAGAAVVIAVAWHKPLERLGWRPLSQAAVAAVRACPERLYNHYNQGGLLIWFVPEKRVFVDNRQDPYPLSFLLEHIQVDSGSLPYRPLFKRWGIGCAFLRADAQSTGRLLADGWKVRYRDENWAVLDAPAALTD